MAKDLLGREIKVGDYVIFHNRLYEVKQTCQRSSISIELVEKLKTTRAVRKQAKETCIVSKGDVMKWLLTKGN